MVSLSNWIRRDGSPRRGHRPVGHRPEPTTAPAAPGPISFGIAEGVITTARIPDDITTEPEMLRRLLVLAVRDGLGVNELTAERYLAAHERHQADAELR